ncbi:MAG: DUF370 domain-containing protein [Firmicutes bacterium]|nr:DUF370 domain-containing protein [Bacillota bacterium]
MFLYIGQDKSIPARDIVGIFSISLMENATNREFLNTARDEGFVINCGEEPARSFIVTSEYIYLSNTSANTLRNRSLNKLSVLD